ncbi:MAG TPA: hypothetical protein VIC25_00430, partial [Caulobacteraceae bacterium]
MLDLKKLFGSSNDRKVAAYLRRTAAINALEPQVAGLSDEALRAKTDEFRARFAGGETGPELVGLGSQRLVGKGGDLRFEGIDRRRAAQIGGDLAVVRR